MSLSLAKLKSLEQKLHALAVDKGATPGERNVANLKLSGVRLKIVEIEHEIARDQAFMAEHGFEPKASHDPRQPNAGWQYRNRHESDTGTLRKRDFKSPPKYQRGIDREAWMNLQSEARARAQYDESYFNTMFGIDDPVHAAKNRERLKTTEEKLRDLFKETKLINNICLINGKITKRLLFWTNIDRFTTYWFIIERDTITGETKKSKRFWSRDGALLAHNEDHITWIRTEHT